MNNNPELSILVVTYNQEQYIRQTLDSILSQEYPCTYELIVSDDCSTDSTREILHEYEQKYPDIVKLNLNEKNLRMPGNFFAGMKKVSGNYFMLCGGDDWWLPGKAIKQMQYMETHPEIGMSYTYIKKYLQDTDEYESGVSEPCITLDQLLECNQISALSICMRMDLYRRYLEDVNPEQYDWGMEDYPLILYCAAASKIGVVEEVLGVYRVLGSSISHPMGYKKRYTFWKRNNEIQNYYIKKYTDREPIPFTMKLWKEWAKDQIAKIIG